MAVVTTIPAHEQSATTRVASGITSQRIASLDIVRGIVMILMAIDHVRVFSGVPAGGPTPGVFFTRWITHFVAPAFIFLAGTAAYLHGARLPNRSHLARFLFTRGAWLILLELTVIRLSWTFNFDFQHYLLAGVIWVIGCCMILLAGLVYLPIKAIATFGVLVIAAHNLMDFVAPGLSEGVTGNPLLSLLYFGGGFRLGANGPPLVILYSIVPWIGVMAAGYAFGVVLQRPLAQRRAFCYRVGFGAVLLFVLLRASGLYGDPRPFSFTPPPTPSASPAPSGAPPAVVRRPPMPRALAFLATTKYPASLLFLLMTLGPMFIALGALQNSHGPVASALATLGRVPLFYYLLHIPLIHLLACVVSLLRTGAVNPWLFANHPMMNPPPPPGYTWSLPLLYLVTAVAIVLLYFPCRWFARLKDRRRDLTWLSYL
jgi:uncharacterized membrane protein